MFYDTYEARPLSEVLAQIKSPFTPGQSVGIKVHWGEVGNTAFLPPENARVVAQWLKDQGAVPFVFDTAVLYSGTRRTGEGSLQTAALHGFTEEFLGCSVVMGDGLDSKDVVDIPAGKILKTAQVTHLVHKAGFVILSHFKGSVATSFGGALKNIAMGFSSKAHKQRLHSDVQPHLDPALCTKCGICVEVCPTKAASFGANGFPEYDMKLCIGCAQCIAFCPPVALQILWGGDWRHASLQEKMTETGYAIWQIIKDKTVVINALYNIVSDCDCTPGNHPVLARDFGFIAGYHPIVVDKTSLETVGIGVFERAHPGIPWQRQFAHAKELGF
jgi:uncharacterized Fe-S center protein